MTEKTELAHIGVVGLAVMGSILRQTFPLFCHGMSQENPDKFELMAKMVLKLARKAGSLA